MSSHFQTLQSDIRDALLADPWFAPLRPGIIVQDKGDLVTEINTAIQNLGLCILILHIGGRTSNPNLPAPYFDGLKIGLQIAENPLLNRSKTLYKTALESVERAMILLHHQRAGKDQNSTITAAGFQMIEPPKGASVAYQVDFQLSQGIKLTLP